MIKKRRVIVLTVMLLIPYSVLAEQISFVYDDHGRRDPFWPLVTSTGVISDYDSDYSPSELVLEGIISDSQGKNMAIINGRIVKLDEQIGQYTVTKIDKESITLTTDKQKFEVKLKKEE